MNPIRTLLRLVVAVLALIGLGTVLFVVLAYGWDGEPPAVGLERE